MRRLIRCAVVLVMAVFTVAAVAQKRAITEKDIFDFKWIGDTQMAPDGSAVAYVLATVAADRGGYETRIYLLDLTRAGAEPVELTTGPRDSSPRWSPDGKQVAFLRSVEKEGKFGPAQLYVKGMGKGEANPVRLTDLAKGAGNPSWSPDGKAIVVTSLTPQDQEAAKLEAGKKARATGDDAHVSDVRIINREIYRMNGEGYLDPSYVPQLYLVHLLRADGTQDAPWQLTGGRFGVQEYVWRPGSDWIFYTSLQEEEPYYDPEEHNALYAIEAPAGAEHEKGLADTKFADELKIDAHGLAVSHDGKRIAFRAQEHPAKPVSHKQTDLWVMDLNWDGGKLRGAGEPKNLTSKQSYEMGGSVGGDNLAPRGAGRAALSWSPDDAALTDVAAKRGSALLVSVDASSGEVSDLTQEKQAVVAFAEAEDGSRLVALISNPIAIGDLYSITGTRAQTQLTHVNDALFSQLDLKMPEELQVVPTSHPEDIKGETIDTFVQLPPDVRQDSKDGGQKYPAILNIHGGPHSAYGWVFDHEMQWMAARGYVVVYPNPRGSTSYGENFANVIEDNYPNDDFHDLMDAVDAVVQKGWADPERLGVTGGSGGGLLTDWTVTQTTRFKAAAAQRDIVDWANWWYTADLGEFHQYWMKPAPFDNLQAYHDRSPLTYVNNIKTPMMFILGDADYRTPPTAGGEVFFRALKYKKIPTVMVRFPRESHELSRSGEPWHRVERLENIVSWMDKFLMKACEPQYDVAPVKDAGCVAR